MARYFTQLRDALGALFSPGIGGVGLALIRGVRCTPS